MAEIYTVSEFVETPPITCDIEKYNEHVKVYKQDVEDFIRTKMFINEPETGKIIRFPVADGYAEYMVVSIKKPQLIYLEIGDAWHFQCAHLLGADEIKQEIKRGEALE